MVEQLTFDNLEHLNPITCTHCGNDTLVTVICAVCGDEVCSGCIDHDWCKTIDTSLPVCSECGSEALWP